MPGTTSLTKEADLIAAVLLYVRRCRAEGDRDALREMRVGFEEAETLLRVRRHRLKVGALPAASKPSEIR